MAFHKFPRTPHLQASQSATRDDLVLTRADADALLSAAHITVEEKVDGANIGISFDDDWQLRLQKRGRFVTPLSEPQFGDRMQQWLDRHKSALASVFGTQYIVFGEWLVARHTVAYDSLPDYFLAFDVFDKHTQRFLSRSRRDELVRAAGLSLVPTLHSGPWTGGVTALQQLVLTSHSSLIRQPTQIEGVYVRVDDESGQWLVNRAKMVHPDFIQTIEEGECHWSKRQLIVNRLRDPHSDTWDTHTHEEEEQDNTQHADSDITHEATQGSDARDAFHAFLKSVVSLAQQRISTGVDSHVSDGLVLNSGVVCVKGRAVKAAAQQWVGHVPTSAVNNRVQRRGPDFHMTFLTPTETDTLLTHIDTCVTTLTASPDPQNHSAKPSRDSMRAHVLGVLSQLCAAQGSGWVPLGLGQATHTESGTAHYVVVAWPAGQWLRAQLGYTHKDFHITLGFTGRDDVHGVSKGINTLTSLQHLATGALPMQLGTTEPAASGQLHVQRAAVQAAAVLVHEAAALCDKGKQQGVQQHGGGVVNWEAFLALISAAERTLTALGGGDSVCEGVTAQWRGVVTAGVYASKARYHGVMGDLTQCEIAAETALSHLTPTHIVSMPLPHTLLAKRHFQAQDYSRALACFTQALQCLDETRVPEQGSGAVDAAQEAGWSWPVMLMMDALRETVDRDTLERGIKTCTKLLAQQPTRSQPHTDHHHHTPHDHSSSVPHQPLHDTVQSTGVLDPRSRVTVNNVSVGRGEVVDVVLPRNTSWVIQGQLLGSSTPKRWNQIFALYQLGVRLVITLTEEEPLPSEWFARTGVENVFVPVPNYEPPSVEQMQRCKELIDSTIAEGHAVLVHCGGGKGRAGTVLACYTVSQGLNPLHPHTTHTRAQTLPIKAPALAAEQAVRHIRATRPGSIETEQQRRFVGEWAKHAWKVYTKAEQEQEQEQADAQDTHVTAAGAGGVKQQGVGGSTSVTLPGNSKPSTPPRKGSNTAGPSKAQSHASVSGWSAGGSGSGSSQGQVSDVGSSKASTAQRKGDSTAGPSKAQSHATVSAGGSRPSQGQEPDSATGTSRVAGSGSSQGQGSEGGSPGVTSVGEYPRTPHLPWSPKVASDDTVLSAFPPFLTQVTHTSHTGPSHTSSHTATLPHVVITEKLDGGNCCVVGGSVFARTHRQPASHPSFGQVKALAGQWDACGLLPAHIAVYGENMAAVHGIKYDALTSPFYMFAVYDSSLGQWLSWSEVVEWSHTLNCPHVPVIYNGPMPSEAHLRQLLTQQATLPSCVGTGTTPREGFVVRTTGRFPAGEFGDHVSKYVCSHFTQSQAVDWARHWKPATIHSPGSAWPLQPTAPLATLPVLSAADGQGRRAPTQPSQTGPARAASPTQSAGAAAAASTSAEATSGKVAGGTGEQGAGKRGGGGKKGGGRGGGSASGSQAAAGNLPKVVFLVGLPGSGKSSFAARLAASHPRWRRVCQDECGGSRSACEREWSQVTLRELQHGVRAILDRCNATVEDRKSWMDLALIGKRDKGVWAVYFDTGNADACKARVMARTNHPTIPQGRGGKAVESFAKILQPPTTSEGFERVITVHSFEESNALLQSWGARPVEAPEADAGAGPSGHEDWAVEETYAYEEETEG